MLRALDEMGPGSHYCFAVLPFLIVSNDPVSGLTHRRLELLSPESHVQSRSGPFNADGAWKSVYAAGSNHGAIPTQTGSDWGGGTIAVCVCHALNLTRQADFTY